MSEDEANALEEAAVEQLGVQEWDRPAIFRETAEAATENRLPYWLVLVLSGAIATLGLALDSSAVVIGAMLVAPLLAPVVGLALSFAVGDGRLAVQTGLIVMGSTLAVVATAAALTILLPFQTITAEIASRARPTTLDLAIAICSGLVGAVVTVSRGSRLSAAIPGVAISVALIPPLAVAGFGIGIGGDAGLIRGSLLLYGANLAGIVLSGMAVFLLVGMQRIDVVEAARSWEGGYEPHGLAGLASRPRWVRSLGVFSSARGRIGMVAIFAVLLGVPLSETLAQIAREARIDRAITTVGDSVFAAGRGASLLGRRVIYGADASHVYLRVATTRWLGQGEREQFQRRVSAVAGEPVRLSLEQIPTRGESLEQLAALLGTEASRPGTVQATPPFPDLLISAAEELSAVMRSVVLPDSVVLVGGDVSAGAGSRPRVRVRYASARPLPREAREMLRRQLALALDLPSAAVELGHLPLAWEEAGELPGDTAVLRGVVDALAANDGLAAEIAAGASAARPGDDGRAAAAWMVARGIEAARVRVVPGEGEATRVRLVPARAQR